MTQRPLAAAICRAIFACTVCVVVSGCASTLTGIDSTSEYGCKAPIGVKCDSVAGTYYNALAGNLPSQRRGALRPVDDPRGREIVQAGSTPTPRTSFASAVEGEPTPAAALRAAPKVLRLWIKPWEDADRDLNGESVVFVQVDNGRWLLDHAQRLAREPYKPVRPPKAIGTKPAAISGKPSPTATGAGGYRQTPNPVVDAASTTVDAVRNAVGRIDQSNADN